MPPSAGAVVASASTPARSRSKLAVLRNRNYAPYFAGQLVSQTGMWMQVVAEGWLVLELTGKVSALGLVSFAFALPAVLFSLSGGAIADRFDRRKVVIATQCVLMVNALAIGAMIALGKLDFYVLLTAAAASGVANAFDMPARSALTPDLVEPHELPSAIALNQATFHGSRMLGPAVAALVLDRGRISAGYFANGLSYIAVIAGLLFVRVNAAPRPARANASLVAAIGQGIDYARGSRKMKSLLAASALAVLFVFPTMAVLPPAFIKEVLHEGPRIIGINMAISGATALVAAVATMWIPEARRALGMVIAALASAAAVGLMNVAPTVWTTFVWVAVLSAGFSMMVGLMMATLSTVAGDIRGRVMSLSQLVFNAGMPVGALSATFAVERFGFACAYAASAVIYALLVVPTLLAGGAAGSLAPRSEATS